MTARTETLALMQRATQRGITLSFADANTLRRAQITLHRWGEQERNGNIRRNERGFAYRYNHRARFLDPLDPRAWSVAPDREKGALKRIKEVCDRTGLHFYHQTDPRGCALYVSNEPMTDNNYSHALACC